MKKIIIRQHLLNRAFFVLSSFTWYEIYSVITGMLLIATTTTAFTKASVALFRWHIIADIRSDLKKIAFHELYFELAWLGAIRLVAGTIFICLNFWKGVTPVQQKTGFYYVSLTIVLFNFLLWEVIFLWYLVI